MAKLWIGVDIGRAHHHVAAVDGEGRLVFSRKVDNDERDILAVIAEVAAVGRPVCWAVDVTTGLAALLLALGDTVFAFAGLAEDDRHPMGGPTPYTVVRAAHQLRVPLAELIGHARTVEAAGVLARLPGG